MLRIKSVWSIQTFAVHKHLQSVCAMWFQPLERGGGGEGRGVERGGGGGGLRGEGVGATTFAKMARNDN